MDIAPTLFEYGAQPNAESRVITPSFTTMVKAKFHYSSWFGASSELASVMEFGFYWTTRGYRLSGHKITCRITSLVYV